MFSNVVSKIVGDVFNDFYNGMVDYIYMVRIVKIEFLYKFN